MSYSMEISVISHVKEEYVDVLSDKVVIILDIFRATSFIVTAFAFGAKRVIPVQTIEEARRLATNGRILAGERFGEKIEGFDLGNSPTSLRDFPVKDKEIVLTTTNGTKAIAKAEGARNRLIGSFLNLSACARSAVQLGRSIVIFCSGTNGTFSLEDGVAAGAIIETCLQMKPTYQVSDLGMMMRQSYLAWRRQGWNELKNSQGGRRVIELGSEEDLDYSLQVDRFPFTPMVTDQGIVRIDNN